MKSSPRRGFTLIELLVVIAIIGILAAIVMVALLSARTKGVDAAVKSEMRNLRAEMELFAAQNSNNYTNACTSATTRASTILSAAASDVFSSLGTVAVMHNVAGAYNQVTCNDSGSGWIAEAPLTASKSSNPQMWCIDSNGGSKIESSVIPDSSTFQCA